MRTCNRWPIGICSWSLHDDMSRIEQVMTALGLGHLHLAVGAWQGKGDRPGLTRAIERHGWTITCTMIGFPQEDYATLETIRRTGGIAPDAQWDGNRAIVMRALDITADLGAPCLSFHAGFIDHADPAYAETFRDRIRCLADAAGERGLMLLMETGQEDAAELKRFMEALDHPALGINFDPANMILYDKDNPLDAVRVLGRWIRHVHIKDAVRTRVPGRWGREVPWGDGEVGGGAFLDALRDAAFDGALAIEREVGEDRVAEVGLAVERLCAK